MIGFFIGRHYKSINRLLHYRAWWFGEWTKVRVEMGPMEIFWSPEVEEDVLAQLEQGMEV